MCGDGGERYRLCEIFSIYTKASLIQGMRSRVRTELIGCLSTGKTSSSGFIRICIHYRHPHAIIIIQPDSTQHTSLT